tara:strand:+ start:163 stop:441 length:279 start_codon:yes stop_codon:yes gene_type:complete
MATYSPTRSYSREGIKKLFDEIAKLQEEVKHYKHIWKKAESNYEYMMDKHNKKDEVLKDIFLLIVKSDREEKYKWLTILKGVSSRHDKRKIL